MSQVLTFEKAPGEKERSRLQARLDTYRERADACREKYDNTIQPVIDTTVGDVVFLDRDTADDLANSIPATAKAKGKAAARAEKKRSEMVQGMLGTLDQATFRLPSDCHSTLRRHPTMAEYFKIERALREGQANEALDALCLHLTTYLALKVRKTQSTGIIHNTEADRRLQEKRDVIDKWKAKYRNIHHVLLVLGMSDADKTYKILHDDDCKPFTLLVSEVKGGDSYKQPTWIWGDFTWAERLEPGEVRTFVGHGKCSINRMWLC